MGLLGPSDNFDDSLLMSGADWVSNLTQRGILFTKEEESVRVYIYITLYSALKGK